MTFRHQGRVHYKVQCTVRSFFLEETLEENARKCAPAGPPSLPVCRTRTSYERPGRSAAPPPSGARRIRSHPGNTPARRGTRRDEIFESVGAWKVSRWLLLYGRGRGIALLPTPRRARSWQLHALEALPLNSLPNALVSQPSAFRPTQLALSGHPSGGRRQRGEPSDGDQLIHGRLRWRRAGATQP